MHRTQRATDIFKLVSKKKKKMSVKIKNFQQTELLFYSFVM